MFLMMIFVILVSMMMMQLSPQWFLATVWVGNWKWIWPARHWPEVGSGLVLFLSAGKTYSFPVLVWITQVLIDYSWKLDRGLYFIPIDQPLIFARIMCSFYGLVHLQLLDILDESQKLVCELILSLHLLLF